MRKAISGLLLMAGSGVAVYGQDIYGGMSSSAVASVAIIAAVLLVWSIIPLFICASMAGRKGKSKGLWVFLAILFGWIAVLVLAAAASEK